MSNSPLPTTVDVAVVGGGLAGLTAAATAARAGASVAVLDAHAFGGRARSTNRDGYVLNEGAHALYRAAGGWAVLERLGVRPRGGTPPADEFRAVWNGEVVDLPVSTSAILRSRLLSVRSKMKLGSWFGDLAGLVATAPDRTFGEWLDDHRAGADLRAYLLATARLSTYAARPERLPAATVLRQFIGGAEGVAYLDGGWQSIVDQLAGVARDAGAVLVDHGTVTSVDDDGGRWTLSSRRGSVDAASVVLAAAGPVVAAGLLGDDPAGWVERAGPVVRASCLDVGGPDGPYQLLLSVDEPLYASRHAPVADLAPDGAALYTLMRYLAHDDDAPARQNRADLERFAGLAGLPPSGGRSVERFLAAPVVTWGSPVVGVERPTGAELADRGVFAAGDWIGPRLLADASITSGASAGAAAAQRAMVAA